MKHFTLLLLVSAILIGCQKKENNSVAIPAKNDSKNTVANVEDVTKKISDSAATVETKRTHGLILTSNALQVINKNTGSTSEIPFGKPFDQMIEIITNVIQSKPKTIGINSECDAGPLKMVS